MKAIPKPKPLWIVVAILVGIPLILQLVGVTLLFVMGYANQQAVELKNMLLAEESVWVDEQNQYQIVFSAQQNGGILYDLQSDAPPIGFDFGHPGTIRYWEMDASGDHYTYARDVYLGTSLFSYDSATGALKLYHFNMQEDTVAPGANDLVFYRK